MNDKSTCDRLLEEFVIERYAAGRLSEEERLEFEEHLITCERCQEELQLAIAIRESLPELEEHAPRPERGGGGSSDTPSPRSRQPRRFGHVTTITLALAAVLATVLLLRPPALGPYSDLGAVTQPPVYLGVQVRGADPVDEAFDAAMSAYLSADYAAAAEGLSAALAAGADVPPAAFFLGASRLMEDDAEQAIEAFDRVIAAGDTPYLAEARYYRAKALLRLDRPAEALQGLRSIPTVAEVGPQAAALADSLERRMTE